jgi:uncharacterized RmlC-like cupin family protein
MDEEADLKRGRVVAGTSSYTSRQGSVYAPGISAETVGAKAVFLGMVTIAPGGRTKAHLHALHESAFYLLSGEAVELCTGARLEHRDTAHAGDYLFIPANVPHVAVNRGRRQRSSSACATSPRRRRAWSCCPSWTASCHERLRDLRRRDP